MDLAKRYEELQGRANQLAIQESNLRDQIEPLQMQLADTSRTKQLLLGSIQVLREQIQEQQEAAQLAESKSAPVPPAENGQAKKAKK